MSSLAESLAGVTRLALDTAPLIYLVERHPQFCEPVREVVELVEKGRLRLVTSTVTLTEVLVQPFRHAQPKLADAYRDILTNSPNVEILSIDPTIAEAAARLRALHGLKTPDAIQVAAAIEGRCQALLTNDPAMKRVPDLQVLLVSDWSR